MLERRELEDLLRTSYELVVAKLPGSKRPGGHAHGPAEEALRCVEGQAEGPREAKSEGTREGPLIRYVHSGAGRPFPVPNDQVRHRRLAADIAKPRRVLPAMVVAVHRALRQRLCHRDRQGRILEPSDVDRLGEPRIRDGGHELRHLIVIRARVRFQIRQLGEVHRVGQGPRRLPVSNRPPEHALHEVNVMQPLSDGLVVSRGRMRLDRAPMLGVRPGLVIVESREVVGSSPLNYLQRFDVWHAKTSNRNRVACRLHRRPAMDAAEFDRLVARALDPRLVPGIYNYCDGRCPRCRFTDRCLTYLDNQELKARRRRRLAGRHDGRLGAADAGTRRGHRAARGTRPRCAPRRRHCASAANDAIGIGAIPCVLRAREYGHFAWRVGRAIIPIVIARGDAGVIEAVETIEWFASMISSKIHRAVRGQVEGWDAPDQVADRLQRIREDGVDWHRRVTPRVGCPDAGREEPPPMACRHRR